MARHYADGLFPVGVYSFFKQISEEVERGRSVLTRLAGGAQSVPLLTLTLLRRLRQRCFGLACGLPRGSKKWLTTKPARRAKRRIKVTAVPRLLLELGTHVLSRYYRPERHTPS